MCFESAKEVSLFLRATQYVVCVLLVFVHVHPFMYVCLHVFAHACEHICVNGQLKSPILTLKITLSCPFIGFIEPVSLS